MRKKQRIIFNQGKLQTTVVMIQVLTQEMNRVAQLLRDDGVSVEFRQDNPETKTDAASGDN